MFRSRGEGCVRDQFTRTVSPGISEVLDTNAGPWTAFAENTLGIDGECLPCDCESICEAFAFKVRNWSLNV